jgi:hypothetical protein
MLLPSKQILWNPGATSVVASGYAILATDKNLNVDTSLVAISLLLPNPTLLWEGSIADIIGNAWQNNITFDRNGGSYTINNVAANLVVNSPFGGWYAYSDGTNYTVVGPV